MNPTPDFELTAEEQALLASITVEDGAFRDHIHARENGAKIDDLMRLLNDRGAIPEQRVKWFTDSEFNPGGRGKSRMNEWERNGTSGRAIFRHPNFLKILRYFLFGPDLPASVIAAFKVTVDGCHGHITSSDVTTLSASARQIARAHRLEPSKGAEEFYKLGLDSGMGHWASFVRDQVKGIRYTR